jgi:hypothetical protein
LGFVVDPVEPLAELAPVLIESFLEAFFEAFFEAFLLAFFDFFMPVESLFVVVVAEVSLEPVEVEPVWATALNETRAKAESTAAIVRIMLISFVFLTGIYRTGWCPRYSKRRAA